MNGLVECSECKHKVASDAVACPSCGHPLTARGDKRDSDTRIAAWIIGPLAFGVLLAITFAGWIEPGPTVRFVMAVAAAFLAYLMSGAVSTAHSVVGVTIRATGGIAVFLLLLLVVDPTQVAPGPKLEIDNPSVDELVVGKTANINVDVQNRGGGPVRGKFVVAWSIDDTLIQSYDKHLDLGRGGVIRTGITWAPRRPGNTKVGIVLRGNGIEEHFETTRNVMPSDSSGRRVAGAAAGDGNLVPPIPRDEAGAGFLGKWYLSFTFQENTSQPAEPPHPWLAFEAEFSANGDSVRGRLQSAAVDGEFIGVVNGKELGGQVRFGWDPSWWRRFVLTLSNDGRTATGAAVYYDQQSGATHTYSVGARRLSSD